MDRDERLARLYFDLTAVSVVEPDVRKVMSEMKENWRPLLTGMLSEAADGPPPKKAESGAVFVLAGLDGLALERLEHRRDVGVRGPRRRCCVRAAASALTR